MRSRRRRLVVHAGTPKTGSTTLQRALAALDPHLRERGIHVPAAARDEPGLARHANLLRRLSGYRYAPEKGEWRALVEEVRASDARVFVISDEAFGQRPPSGIHRAIAELAARCGLEVDVVAYVRPQCQYLESLYAQDVKGGFVEKPFGMYTGDAFAMRPVARHPWLDYGRAFAPWRAAFGDRVAVTPFEPSRLPGGLVAHFLGLLGCGELAGAVPDIRANTRIGAKELEVHRLTTMALRRAGRREPWWDLERLHGLRELVAGDRAFAGLSAVRAQDLMERFGAANAAFARDWGISAEGVLFEDSPVDGLARPNIARWGDLTSHERAAVREYVREVVGVDPAPRSGRGGGRTIFAPRAGRTSWLGRARHDAPIGSLRWRAAWIVDRRVLHRLVRALVRRARALVARAPRPVDDLFDADGREPARGR